jgi:serine/threonine protein kinase
MTEHDPDPHLLEDFFLGRLADADAERVATHLAEDPRWQALARDLHVSDPLVEAVRSASDFAPPESTPSLRELMDRLEKLARSPAQVSTCDALGDTSPAAGQVTDPGGLSFLRPAQSPGELGRLAGFRILEVLGRGGMGLVLRAEDMQLRRQVALKVIKPERVADPHYRERFLREARAAAALHHDHVMPVLQIGEDNGALFLAMPLLPGQTLEARLTREPLTIAEQLRIGRETALGLAAAHERGLIHRDIKPSNVWLEEKTGRVRILDFGLALPAEGGEHLTETGAVLGTPAYMSPEQADSRPLDARSDLFSLGCVLYRMATGRQPFGRPSVTATLRAIADHHPAAPHQVAPQVPAPLSHLILRLLAKSPKERPESAGATADALQAIEQGNTRTESLLLRPVRTRDRKRVAAVVAVLLLGGISLGVLVAVWAFHSPGPAPSAANTGPGQSAAETPRAEPAKPPQTVSPGYVDATLWTTGDGTPRKVRLSEEGALPMANGDKFRVEAEAAASAYFYLFLIDEEGTTNPLYPWQPGKWGTRPPSEEKKPKLELPTDTTKGWTVSGDKAGMWTLLLLVRDTPWEASDDEVKQLFAGLPPQRPVQNPRSAVWFENGQVVKNDDLRRSVSFEESDINDPVLRVQALLRDKLQPHARFTTAVSFAKRGK